MKRLDAYTERIIENAIELASGYIEPLQERCAIGRDALISHCIIPWAVSAEQEYQTRLAANGEVEYYDFIDAFGARMLEKEIGHGA